MPVARRRKKRAVVRKSNHSAMAMPDTFGRGFSSPSSPDECFLNSIWESTRKTLEARMAERLPG
jgi:hypothetical protein